ncbi:MAG: gamma-glutamyltransferase [Nitrososphaerales archaeon]|nr:gamma-glutamyltransferase [Nitrososphaerales archaeon]
MDRLHNAVVTSAHPLASEAGASILRMGGNAVDAAVATSLMLGVVEPAFSGIGGGGFALIHLASGETTALDYRETAPAKSSADMFQRIAADANSVGPLAVATPGTLSGHALLLEQFGTMKFRDVARPAIVAAKSGVSVSSLSQRILKENRTGALDKLKRFTESARVFGVDGRSARFSKLPLLSKTLSKLAKDGPEGFYGGTTSKEISTFVGSLGGILSEDDFGRYAPKVRRPVEGEARGFRIVSMPPPSAGGTLLIYGLEILAELGNRARASTKAGMFRAVIDILRSMLDEKPSFGDPEFVDAATSQILSKSYVQKKAEEIWSGTNPTGGNRSSDGPGSTSHFCVIDSAGNVVSATETIECYFGSGVTVPGLGVLLNDEMHDFDTVPGRPNSVAAGKRPVSSMSPTIVFKDGSPFLVIGGAGSERIISSIFQVTTNVLDGGMALGRALAAPRIHPTAGGLMVEGGFDETTVSELRGLVGDVQVMGNLELYFGGVQAVLIDQDKRMATGGADPRRFGAAVSA